jgi:3-hydroxyisobutyrate dehydrogenase-like beta-hydroxyacid dehydrogenase
MNGRDTRTIRCGFIGLGSQGAPIARRMIDAGYPTTLWARREASFDPYRGTAARFASSIEELGANSEHVGICVLSDADVREVCERLIPSMQPGAVIAVHSTIHPRTCQEIARNAMSRSIDVIDAPVSGGAPAAEAGELTLMLGGDARVIERARPVFQTFGKLIVHLGGAGAGQKVKLLNNSLLLANLGLAHTVLEAGISLGIDRDSLAQVLLAGSGRSFALEVRARMKSPAGFRMGGKLLKKDFDILKELVGANDPTLDCLNVAAAQFLKAAAESE